MTPPPETRAPPPADAFAAELGAVAEEATEAAAATAVVMKSRGRPAPTPDFRADHPFLFLIQHNETGAILFLGRLTNPTAG